MESDFFEQIHKAKPDLPYINLWYKNLNYTPHYHSETEIIYITSGSIVVTIDGVDNTLLAGDIFIIMPGKIHSFFTPECSTNYIMKLYTPEGFDAYNTTSKLTPDDKHYNEFKEIIDNIVEEKLKNEKGSNIALTIHANQFMLKMLRTLDIKETSEQEKIKNKKNIELAKKITDYFEEHFTEDISLDDLSKYCGYSKYHFSHIFKEVTSMSFPEFLSSFRIEKSKSLLLSGKSISETAFSCGFNNLRSFNRDFKKHLNTTPKDYKKNR